MRMDRRAGIVALDTLYTWEKYEYVYEHTYEESSTTSTVYFYYPDPLYYYDQESNSTASMAYRFYVGTDYSFSDSNGKFTVSQTTGITMSTTGASNAIGKYYVSATSSSGSYSGTTLYHIIDVSLSGSVMTLTLEVFVSYSNKTYVGDSFSFDNTTGNFTVDQTTPVNFTTVSNNVGKYYVEETIVSGTYTSSTIYHITACTYGVVQGNVRLTLTIAPLTSSITSNKIKGAYICDVKSNNLIRYPFNGPQGDYWYIFKYTDPFTYSGDSVSRGIYYMDSKYYEVYELTSSGTFTPTKPISNIGIWICGGGCGGTSSGYAGGAGAYVNSTTVNVRNPITITIGAGGVSSGGSGGTTSVEFSESPTISTLSAASGVAQDGGTGGGSGGRGSAVIGLGDGIDKHPFNSLLFNSYCDGGGGGHYENSSGDDFYAGDGGTNGRNGTSDGYRGRGGGLYGGQGGKYAAGKAGVGYGSGGGGGSRDYDSSYHNYSGGNGYQGACFIRIPLSQGNYEYSLPEGYTKLDYVQSTAAQAIDTGVFMTNNPSMCIECEFSLDSVMESGYAAYMFGAQGSSGDGGEFVFKDTAGSFKASNGSFSSSFTLDTTSIYDVYMSTKISSFVSIKNTSTTYYASINSELATDTSSIRPSLAIFCRHYRQDSHSDPVYTYRSRIKLYYFRIYDNNGLIRNFIPVKNSSNVAGLYDTVNDVFYTSVTGTDLIAGNVIS